MVAEQALMLSITHNCSYEIIMPQYITLTYITITLGNLQYLSKYSIYSYLELTPLNMPLQKNKTQQIKHYTTTGEYVILPEKQHTNICCETISLKLQHTT